MVVVATRRRWLMLLLLTLALAVPVLAGEVVTAPLSGAFPEPTHADAPAPHDTEGGEARDPGR